MSNRRAFLGALGVLAAPRISCAQPTTSLPRIGFLTPSFRSDPRVTRYMQALREGLRELGYVEGQTIAIESRFAEGKWDQLYGLAAELVVSRWT